MPLRAMRARCVADRYPFTLLGDAAAEVAGESFTGMPLRAMQITGHNKKRKENHRQYGNCASIFAQYQV
jgi:hypothetical protein